MTDLSIGACRDIYCNMCKRDTHHELLVIHPKHYGETVNEPYPQPVFWEEFQYRLWACRGCDTVTYETAYTHMDSCDEDGNQIWTSELFPRRARTDRLLKQFRQLNEKLTAIYGEVIASFNADSRILCAIGLRALLEGICAEKQIRAKDLSSKIEGLKAHLPTNIVDNLHGFRFMGNEAAHELEAPKRHELKLAIEVMEDLLNFLYELEYKARGLPKR